MLAAPRPEPAEHAQRIVTLQRNIMLPARLLVVSVAFYQLYSSPWLGAAVNTFRPTEVECWLPEALPSMVMV